MSTIVCLFNDITLSNIMRTLLWYNDSKTIPGDDVYYVQFSLLLFVNYLLENSLCFLIHYLLNYCWFPLIPF